MNIFWNSNDIIRNELRQAEFRNTYEDVLRDAKGNRKGSFEVSVQTIVTKIGCITKAALHNTTQFNSFLSTLSYLEQITRIPRLRNYWEVTWINQAANGTKHNLLRIRETDYGEVVHQYNRILDGLIRAGLTAFKSAKMDLTDKPKNNYNNYNNNNNYYHIVQPTAYGAAYLGLNKNSYNNTQNSNSYNNNNKKPVFASENMKEMRSVKYEKLGNNRITLRLSPNYEIDMFEKKAKVSLGMRWEEETGDKVVIEVFCKNSGRPIKKTTFFLGRDKGSQFKMNLNFDEIKKSKADLKVNLKLIKERAVKPTMMGWFTGNRKNTEEYIQHEINVDVSNILNCQYGK